MYTLIFANPVLFLSTLSLRRATHKTENNCIDYCISIHALLAESDAPEKALQCVETPVFLSTLSLRRATLFALLCNLLHNNFYPRSPCGERLSY